MMRTIPILLILALAGSLPAMGHELSVDFKTDYRPILDFDNVHVRLIDSAGYEALPQTYPVYLEDNFDVLDGIRVANFSSVVGNYTMYVQVRDERGNVLAQRPVSLTVTSNFGLTAVVTDISQPDVGDVVAPAAVTQDVELLFDADGDGLPGSGDILRYHARILGPAGAGVFEETIGGGARLIAGSATSTHGPVLTGNGPNDSRLIVSIHAVDAGETATVTFDTTVAPVVAGQGRLQLEEQTGEGHSVVTVPTDDPATPQPFDANITPIDVAGFECAQTAVQLDGELTALLHDFDDDGVALIADECPATAAGDPVGDRGCSRAQFCATIDVSAGDELCNNSDWQNDEPRGNPRDCKASDGLCQAR